MEEYLRQQPSADGAGATPPTPGLGRDASGRFAPGNKFGPGNPYARQVAALRKALAESVTEEEIRAVGRMLLLRALEGDLAAAKLLFTYVIGKPAAAVDPDTLDRQEFELFRQLPVPGDEVDKIAKGLPADWAVHVLRHVMPCRTATMMNQLEGVMDQKAQQNAKQEERRATKAERKAQRRARREAEKAARKAQKAAEVVAEPAPSTESNGPDGPRPTASPVTDGPDGSARPPSPNGSDGPGGAAAVTNGPDGSAPPPDRGRSRGGRAAPPSPNGPVGESRRRKARR